MVKDSFLDNTAFNLTVAEEHRAGDYGWDDSRVNPAQNYTKVIYDMQQDAVSGSFEELNISACFDLYDDYWQPQGNGLVFVKNQSAQTSTEGSLLMYVSIIPRYDDWAKNMWALGNGTGHFLATSPDFPVTTWYLGPPHYEVSRCLVQKMDDSAPRCRFEYSPGIMFAVCSLNFIKANVMICVWLLRRWQNRDKTGQTPEEKAQALQDQIMYTLGDAISSFMRQPDVTTKDMCLASKEDFLWKRSYDTKFRNQAPQPSTKPQYWASKSRYWMSSASPKRWIILLSM